MRNKIKEKLLEVDKTVYYGLVPSNVKDLPWDYIVFGQKRLRKKDGNSTDLQGYWYVTIVRENFIPDDDVFTVIKKLNEISGLRLADGECSFVYTTKGNTDDVVEILELQFTRTLKSCDT